MLGIYLLGHFKMTVDGVPVGLPSRQAQSLLAYLLIHRDKRHRREMLAGLLWPDLEENKARSRLRYAIWQLRKAIGDDYLLSDRIDLAFNTETDYWLDVDSFDRSAPMEMPANELEKILSAYEGDLLPGFYDDWIVLERDRIQSAFESRMELLLTQLVDEGRWRETIDWAEKWIGLGHLPEVAYRALMIAHNQLGDVSSALMAYHRCQLALDEQLAVEPSYETQRIHDLIAAGHTDDGHLVNDVDEFPSDPIKTRPAPPFPFDRNEFPDVMQQVFVGREKELLRMEHSFELAQSGQGRVIIIKGDAGRGKTTLLKEFSRRTLRKKDDSIVLWGTGEALTGLGDSYLPFRDTLTLLTGDLGSHVSRGWISMEGAGRLWELIPESVRALVEEGPDLIGTFFSGSSLLSRLEPFSQEGEGWFDQLKKRVGSSQEKPAPVHIQHSDIQKDLFEQYTRLLQRISGSNPLVVILDDLQWADPGSSSLLFHLGRRVQGHSILVVASYRPLEAIRGSVGQENPLGSVLSEFKRTFGEIEIDLDRTNEADGRSFVEALLDSEPNQLSEEFRGAIYQRTRGHPLFTVELLRQMQSKGEIRKDRAGIWIEGQAIEWGSLPARVEAVIASRLAQLSPAQEEILRIASVEGEEFSAQVVARIREIGEGDIISQLSLDLARRYKLVEALGIVRVNDQRVSRYRFRHQLFQMYVYNSLDETEKARYHDLVGRELEVMYGNQSDEIAVRLARHFEVAGDIEKAVEYLLLAGEGSKRLSDNGEAIAHLMKGLELLQSLSDTPARNQRELALTIALAAPMVATRGYSVPEVEQIFERARELCQLIDDPSQLVTALWGLWSFYLVRANFGTAHQLASQIFELAQSVADPELLLVGDWTLGITLVHLGEFSAAREHLDQAVDRFHPERHQPLTYLYGQNPGVTCLIYSAFALSFLGYPMEAREKCFLAVELGRDCDHEYSLAFVHSMVAVFYAIWREPEAALMHAQEATRLSKESGFPFLMAAGMIIRGWARATLGKGSITIREMSKGLDMMQALGAELGLPIFLGLIARIYGSSGQVTDAEEVLEQAVEASRKNREMLYDAELHRFRGELLANQGAKTDEIETCYRQAADIARQQKAKSLELRASVNLFQLLESREQGREAREELAKVFAWFSEGFETTDLIEARNLLETRR
ncbi:MAG TPA: AAA family ATPase [candidate division Zixibacteria bacterium]|nr:AAA family ATPase [candidate division Zixibacteria bacterium]